MKKREKRKKKGEVNKTIDREKEEGGDDRIKNKKKKKLGSEILTANFHFNTYLAGQKLERDRKILRGGGGGTRATTRN